MRSLLVALSLVLATASVAPAQQFAPSESDRAVQPDPGTQAAPIAIESVELAPVPLTPAAVQAEQPVHAALESRSAAQISAQTVLAVIGAVVVIVALVALFN